MDHFGNRGEESAEAAELASSSASGTEPRRTQPSLLGDATWPRGTSGSGVRGPAAVRTEGRTHHPAAALLLLGKDFKRPAEFLQTASVQKVGQKTSQKTQNFQKFPDSNEARSTGTAGCTHAAPDSGALSSASLPPTPLGGSENGLNALLGPEAIFHSSDSNLWSSLNLYLLCLAPLCAACRNPRAVTHSEELIVLSTGAA